MTQAPVAPYTYQVELHRTFNAPPALVFEAWSRPEHWQRWFPPHDFTMTIEHMDFRVGGTFAAAFHGMGMDHPFSGTYVEIVPGEKLAWTSAFPDSQYTDQMLTTVSFKAVGDKTEVTVVQAFRDMSPETDMRVKGAPIGWGQTLDNLGQFLAERQGA